MKYEYLVAHSHVSCLQGLITNMAESNWEYYESIDPEHFVFRRLINQISTFA